MSAVKDSGLMDLLAARWNGLAPRERTLVGSAIALVAVALLWWVGISPALTQLRQARAAAPALDAQLQLMRSQAAQAASLKAQRSLSYDESLRSLENTVKSAGGVGGVGAAGAVATLAVSDARATITLRGIKGDALAQMLAQLRSNARLVPSELRLKQAATSAAPAASNVSASNAAAPTTWDGTMVISLPAR